MEDLTPNEVARLHLKARHETLTPEEQSRYSEMEPASVKRRSDHSPTTGKAPQPKRSILNSISVIVLVILLVVVSFIAITMVLLGQSAVIFQFAVGPALIFIGLLAAAVYGARRDSARNLERRAVAEGDAPLSPEAFFALRSSYKGHMQDFDFMGCYVIHNLTNGMYYVGQATHVPQRVNAHFTGKGNGDVYADYRYGNQFEIYMVDITTTNYRRLDDLERDLIATYDAYNRGYNKTRGNK